MSQEIRHSFFIDAPASTIAEALMQARHIPNRWTKEAFSKSEKGIFGWSGYGWQVHRDMYICDTCDLLSS